MEWVFAISMIALVAASACTFAGCLIYLFVLPIAWRNDTYYNNVLDRERDGD